jgi:tungstate transport system substrate-binding protein
LSFWSATWILGVALGLTLGAASPLRAEQRFLTLASTTSTRDSGLLADLLPRFEARSGIAVRVVAVGTGRALQLGRAGDVDALLVHDRASEDAFVADGHALRRRDVMYNDFVIVGPQEDPAAVRGLSRAADGLARIAATQSAFLSRGDDSGTHKAERRLWALADLDPSGDSGGWYRETGNGMGATLNTAVELQAYVLSDRGTWLAFRNRGELEILLQGDPPLRNPYGVLVVNPERHPHVKAELAEHFAVWLTSPQARLAIAEFRVDGEPLFHPLPVDPR